MTSEIQDFLRHEIDVGSFPGAVYAAGSSRGLDLEGAMGHAVAVPFRVRAGLSTIYDCASLTKPLVTTTLILQAVAEGRITLEEQFEGFPYWRLLTHTSGLAAWLPLYASGDYVRAILEQGPEYEPGTRVVYSDLNFILLYHALVRLYGDYVARAEERIFRPLGLSDAFFRPAAALRPRIAATEWGQRYEYGMCATRSVVFNGFRSGLIWGETHDGNSHHYGGTAGNAGLFATARDVFRIARGWLDDTLLPRDLVDEAVRNHTAGLNENRGLGWLLSAPDHVATRMLSARAWGHTGFTGTSLWFDPDADRIMVLLTNRVHPCAASVGMQAIRGRFHTLALT
ncbi:MAG TPA: serine hydrolase domain-containing protein [Thermoanaerobaculia bacterium]|nr:serine hydrolase domain-containing protein [Thermoanaerobaculia bacterium]